MNVIKVYEHSATVAVGLVISQDPAPSEDADDVEDPNLPVTITISLGPAVANLAHMIEKQSIAVFRVAA